MVSARETCSCSETTYLFARPAYFAYEYVLVAPQLFGLYPFIFLSQLRDNGIAERVEEIYRYFFRILLLYAIHEVVDDAVEHGSCIFGKGRIRG